MAIATQLHMSQFIDQAAHPNPGMIPRAHIIVPNVS